MILLLLQKLKSNEGSVTLLWSPSLVIIFFMILAFAMEILRIQTIFSHIERAADAAVVSACTMQTPDVYNGAIEGSAISRYPDGEADWEEYITTDIVMNLTADTLGLQSGRGGYYRIENNRELYRIVDMEVEFENIEGDVLNFETVVDVSVPIYFGNEIIPPLERSMIVKSSYMLKF